MIKKIIFLLSALGTVFFISINSVQAIDASTQLTIERAGRMVASSYKTGNPDKKLFGLHKDYFPKRPRDLIHTTKSIEIITKHSLQETNEKSSSITGYKQYENWLSDVRRNFRFPDNLDVRTMSTCLDGCCKFSLDGGISHNHLYLTQACFYVEESKPYLKSITLLDSD